MSAATVWTYWLAFPLLGAGVVAVVVTAWLYYRRVLVARYEWTRYQWTQHQRLGYQASQASSREDPAVAPALRRLTQPPAPSARAAPPRQGTPAKVA